MLASDEQVLERKFVRRDSVGASIFYVKTKKGEIYTHNLGCPKLKRTFEILGHGEDESLPAEKLEKDVSLFLEILEAMPAK